VQVLTRGAESWGLGISDAQSQDFQTYYEELRTWNTQFNLTAITGYRQVQVRHFLDSLSCLLVLDDLSLSNLSLRVIDIGTGAGFPALPLKLLRPDWDVTLVDSTLKKTQFLEHMVRVLGLTKVSVLWSRAEELGHMAAHREQYHLTMARAVADLPVLAEYLLPLCRIGGMMLAPRGPRAREEVDGALPSIDTLGGRLVEVRSVSVPGLDEERYMVLAEKISRTPAQYPRRPGMPRKRPLS
jgi:16S rRNA (guanine527-N7)-methyltransferase